MTDNTDKPAGKGRGRSKKTSKTPASKKAKKSAPPARKSTPDHEPSFVVGIGASAGGLEALIDFFTAMPEESGLAFVVISHLQAKQKSMLVEILGKHTSMPVKEAEDGERLRADHVYVIPPGKDLHLYNLTLQLLNARSPRGLHTPIDIFFQSLAEERQDKAIGIILSGMGSDGSVGLRFIKTALGMTMAQEPGSAQSTGMPERAIQTGLVDFVLPPAQMPGRLLSYIASPALNEKKMARSPVLVKDEQAALNRIFFLLHKATGHDFSGYKTSTALRRINRRQSVNAIASTAEYLRFVEANPRELRALFKELLIVVTSFFRDPEAFAVLKEQGLKPLLAGKAVGDQFRVWVAGCATGEEAYSVAMALRECLDELRLELQVQIFATDIDAESIELARAGRYPHGIAGDLSEKRLKRFFERDNNNLQVKKEVREMMVFAEQNVLRDPPFTRLDLICCRNLLIYLQPETQKKLLSLFHFSLLPAGFLFLGSSESLGLVRDGFTEIDAKWKCFRKNSEPGMLPEIIIPPFTRHKEDAAPGQKNATASQKEIDHLLDLQTAISEALLGLCAPAAVLINREGKILYIHGHTGKYLEPPQGQANWSIFKMVPKGLELELLTAVRLAVSQNKETVRANLRIHTKDGDQNINLRVHPLLEPQILAGLLLVLFEDMPPCPSLSDEQAAKDASGPAEQAIIHELELELTRSRENLQTVTEELESANEELQSTNEEYQSANEELQSTNEELESSREELQSVNEELVTLNSELQVKVDEASQAYEDMKTFLDNLEIPTIFLDNELRIKQFSSRAHRIVSLLDADIGRPIADLVCHLERIDLTAEARQVLRTLRHEEKEVRTRDGHWHLMRILPYRNMDNSIEGAVLLFIDIDVQKKTTLQLEAVQEARAYAEDVINTVRQPLLVLSGDLIIKSANAAFFRNFQVREEDTVDRPFYELGNGQWDIPRLRELLEEILPKREFFDDFLVDHEFPHLGRRRMLLNARRIRRADVGLDLILLAMEDVTDRPMTAG